LLPTKPDSRCTWCLGDDLYEHYHDAEWGVPLYDDRKLFEFLILEGAQAGLSWITVLRKRARYKAVFDNFDAAAMAQYDERKCQELLKDPGIIRNRLKVHSAVNNARLYLELMASGGFAEFLWSFVEGQPRQNAFQRMDEVPATTPEAEQMSKALKKRGFNFVGPTICYAFMQATGMVNDHLVDCPRHEACAALVDKQ
jgi:DNA-3-methyladenine glycosylase I